MSLCLVTGCGLNFDDGRAHHGDLHYVSGALVFNAVAEGGVPIQVERPSTRALLCSDDHYFERGGLFVLNPRQCKPNDPLRLYIEESHMRFGTPSCDELFGKVSS